jgi:hypothetical protein
MTMMSVPHAKRLSDNPYLLAAVLQLGVFQKSVPMVLAQKAHRLINKHSYKIDELERTAFVCFSNTVGQILNSEDPDNIEELVPGESACANYSLMWAVTNGGPAVMDALDQKDAAIGKLRDFLAHVQSADE